MKMQTAKIGNDEVRFSPGSIMGPEVVFTPEDDDEGGEACAEEDEAEEEQPSSFDYQCSVCGCSETLKQYRGSYVCPWCGDGVMQLEDS